MQSFGNVLSSLRRSADLSQRKLAADLNISQALLSHYENGTREPGLSFVCRACDYFGVSADLLLGRIEEENENASGFPSVNQLDKMLGNIEDDALSSAIADYMDAAASGMLSLLTGKAEPLYITELQTAMASAKLKIVRKTLGEPVNLNQKAPENIKNTKMTTTE